MGAICASSCASIYMEDFESTHLSVQKQSNNILAMHRGFIFHIERNRGGTTIVHRRRPQKKPPSIKLDFKYTKIEVNFLGNKIYKDWKD